MRELFIKAKKLIEMHGWIQGEYGDCVKGFCIYGAIDKAVGEKPAQDALYSFIAKIVNNKSLSVYNDTPGRTKEEILAVFDKAIASS